MKNDYIEIVKLEEKQKLLLAIFKEFHNICENNGLVYNIFGGTLLGAVRHKGMIPWDDDIDVTMPLNDYYKFINIVKESHSKKYTIHSYPDENYIYPFAKFGFVDTELYECVVKEPYNKLTLNIDVFPNYGYPSDESIFKKYVRCEKSIILLTYYLPKTYNPIKFIFYRLLRKIKAQKGYCYYIEKQIAMLSASKEEINDYIVCQGGGWGKKGKLKKSVYYDRVLYDFKDLKVWGIKDYDEHLHNLYGDYMTPPPLKKRFCPHNTKLFVSNKIYEEYLEGN